MRVTWNREDSVGIPLFDKHHMELFDIINDFTSGSESGHKKEATEVALTDLFKYAKEHFTAEEDAMKKVSYPKYEEHKTQHQDFVQIIQEVKAKMETDHELANEVLTILLSTWLKTHISDMDKEYTPYLKGKV